MDVRQSYQGVLPRLDLTGGFGRLFVGETEEVTVVSNPTPPPDFVRSAVSVPPSDFGDYRYNLALSWTLFDGLASWNLISASRTRSTASERQLDESTLRVAFEVTRRFYELVKQQRALEVRRETAALSEELVKRADALYSAGPRHEGRHLRREGQPRQRPDRGAQPGRGPGGRPRRPGRRPRAHLVRRAGGRSTQHRRRTARSGAGAPSASGAAGGGSEAATRPRGAEAVGRGERQGDRARARRLLADARCPGVLREDVRRGGRAIRALRRSVGPVRRLGAVHRGVEPVRGRRDAGERAARRGRVAPCVDPPRAGRADGRRRGDRRPRAGGGAHRHRSRRSRRTSPPPRQASASRGSGSRPGSRASSRCETPRSSSRRRGSSGSARSWTSSWLAPT